MASAVEVPEVRDRLVTLLEAVDGIRAAYQYWPSNLEDVETPCYLIVPSAAEHDDSSFTDHEVRRRWRIFLLVGKWTIGGYGSLQKVLDPFYERTGDVFIGNYQLDGLDAQVFDASIINDTGEQVIEFPPKSGQYWLGTEYTVLITTQRRITRGT